MNPSPLRVDIRASPEKKLFTIQPVSRLRRRQGDLGPIFRTFFPGKIPRKIPRKIFPKNVGKKFNFLREKF
jgi:hypothetical protein